MHISDPAQKSWIQARIEGPDKSRKFALLASGNSEAVL
jgi:2-oxoglutarate dehydrogenase complex dehydrogenase (E1) component-like enzyme